VIKVQRTLNEAAGRGQPSPLAPDVPNFGHQLDGRVSARVWRLSAPARRQVCRIRLVVACRRAERQAYAADEARQA
jgi:hypothetical protein